MLSAISIPHVTSGLLEHDICGRKPIGSSIETAVTAKMDSDPGFIAAVEEAKAGFAEGGVPIGACLVSKEGEILGRGHNMRVQKASPTLHVGPPVTRTRGFGVRALTGGHDYIKGRNLHPGKFWQASSFRVQWCHDVHLVVAMRHVHWCLCLV